MDADVIVPSEVQAKHGLVMLPRFAVGVRQPRHAADGHARCQIASFNVAGANPVGVRAAAADGRVNIDYLGWRITPTRLYVAAAAVPLDELGEVDVELERERDGRLVGREAVGADLETMVAALHGKV